MDDHPLSKLLIFIIWFIWLVYFLVVITIVLINLDLKRESILIWIFILLCGQGIKLRESFNFVRFHPDIFSFLIFYSISNSENLIPLLYYCIFVVVSIFVFLFYLSWNHVDLIGWFGVVLLFCIMINRILQTIVLGRCHSLLVPSNSIFIHRSSTTSFNALETRILSNSDLSAHSSFIPSNASTVTL